MYGKENWDFRSIKVEKVIKWIYKYLWFGSF